MLSMRSGYEFECRIINGIFPVDLTLQLEIRSEKVNALNGIRLYDLWMRMG